MNLYIISELGILFLAGEFRTGAQNDIIVNSEEQLLVINIYGWYGWRLFTIENVIIMHLLIVLYIALGESLFKIALRFLVFY